jgi:hypothetical protein
VRTLAITSICHLLLSRHFSFSVGSEPTALGQFFSHAYFRIGVNHDVRICFSHATSAR